MVTEKWVISPMDDWPIGPFALPTTISPLGHWMTGPFEKANGL